MSHNWSIIPVHVLEIWFTTKLALFLKKAVVSQTGNLISGWWLLQTKTRWFTWPPAPPVSTGRNSQRCRWGPMCWMCQQKRSWAPIWWKDVKGCERMWKAAWDLAKKNDLSTMMYVSVIWCNFNIYIYFEEVPSKFWFFDFASDLAATFMLCSLSKGSHNCSL